MQRRFEAPNAQDTAPKGRAVESTGENMTAAEHEKAAMLAEFNGTYDLARFHRERATELRRSAG